MLIAYIAGTAINIYLLINIVRLLRFKVGVWSPYKVEPKLEGMSHNYGPAFKWLGPIVVLNLAVLSLCLVTMLLLYIVNSLFQAGTS